MENPNNCETCDYKKLNGNREKGWCYMFRDEPTEVCMAHTGRHPTSLAEQIKRARQLLDALAAPNAKLSRGGTGPGKD